MNFIVFDQGTSEVLVANESVPAGLIKFERDGDALSLALEHKRAVMLLPSLENGQTLLLEVERANEKPTQKPAEAAAEPAPVERRSQPRESTGILGLDGDPIYLDELPKKSWWQRLFSSE